jgi:hypothetical protein
MAIKTYCNAIRPRIRLDCWHGSGVWRLQLPPTPLLWVFTKVALQGDMKGSPGRCHAQETRMGMVLLQHLKE